MLYFQNFPIIISFCRLCLAVFLPFYIVFFLFFVILRKTFLKIRFFLKKKLKPCINSSSASFQGRSPHLLKTLRNAVLWLCCFSCECFSRRFLRYPFSAASRSFSFYWGNASSLRLYQASLYFRSLLREKYSSSSNRSPKLILHAPKTLPNEISQ